MRHHSAHAWKDRRVCREHSGHIIRTLPVASREPFLLSIIVQHRRFYTDTFDQKMRLAGISIATLPTGPFYFLDVLSPDKNATVDFTLLQDSDGKAFLARTYYSNTT